MSLLDVLLGSRNPNTPGINPNAPNPHEQNAGLLKKTDGFINSDGGNFLMNLLAQQGFSNMPQSPLAAVGRAGLETAENRQQRERSLLENNLLRARAEGGIRNVAAPSSVREFEFFEKLTDEEKKRFLAVKRAQQVENVPGAGLGSVNPLTGRLDPIVGEGTIVGGIEDRAGAGERGKQDAAIAAIPERVAAQTQAQAASTLPSDLAGLDSQTARIDQTIGKIEKIIPLTDEAGISVATRGDLPGALGGDARKLKQEIKSLQANFAFDTLQKMRAASKSGGALGQVSERELDLLINALQSIDPEGDPETLRENLGAVKRHYENYKREIEIMKGILRKQAGAPTPQKPISEMSDAELEAIINGS